MRLRLGLVGAALLLALGCGDDDGGDEDAGPGMTDDGGTEDAGPLMSTVRPSKRSDVGGAADPTSGTVVIFGGDDGPIANQRPMPNFRDDTWVFEPGVGWTEVVTDTHPSARSRYATAYDAANQRMLLFGGRFRSASSGDYTLYNDLWAFDFASRTWSQVNDGAGGPGPRYFPAMAVDSAGTIYVMGGGLNTNALAPNPAMDLWSFDGTTWTEITIGGTPPSGRLFETWIHDEGRGVMIAFGGQVGDFFSPAFGDMYSLELATGTWAQVDAGTGPAGRFNGMGVHDTTNDRYIIFGGHPDPGTANDIWAWDAANGGWTALQNGDVFTGGPLGCLGNPSEIPDGYVTQDLASPERRQGGVFDVLGDSVWLVMGEGDCSDHLDDIWRFDLSSDSWEEIIAARSGETCARQGNDCMCLCL